MPLLEHQIILEPEERRNGVEIYKVSRLIERAHFPLPLSGFRWVGYDFVTASDIYVKGWLSFVIYQLVGRIGWLWLKE